MTVDYYDVKKSDLIVAGPALADARAAYYSKTNVTDACAAVAAVGAGYSCNLVDAIDPLFPTALPRVLIINAPFVNADYSKTSGVDFSATAKANLPYDAKLTSRLEVTHVLKYDLHTATRVQEYAGTLGPYQLSSGNGTPDWRGNWQNTVEWSRYSLSATAYYVGKIKSVASDQRVDTTCATGNQYAPGNTVVGNRFCYIKKFVNVDVNGTAQITDAVQVYGNIGNVFDEKAPVAPGAYASAPNYLTTFHYAGLIGRTFKVGVRFTY
jgi:iron complex outermembrane receptor protein